ncbi:MAG: rhodanese-like domain-containing protein [Bdellovibrio sp.]|nr:MAG: rhodanese-like domain-containing protein [Bdellovibrio sp.]
MVTGRENVSDEFVVIDCRTPAEYSMDKIDGTINLDFKSPKFTQELEKLDRNKKYKLHCASGARSGTAVQMMQSMGFKHVENIGGIAEARAYLKK